MLVVHYFADGLVATDLDLSVAAIPRRRTLATRLLLGYVAWAKALDVAIVQCGNTTIADRDEFSMSFAIAGFRHVGNVFKHQGDCHMCEPATLTMLYLSETAVGTGLTMYGQATAHNQEETKAKLDEDNTEGAARAQPGPHQVE